LQLRVLRLGSDKNGGVGVCVFPERQEILIGGVGLDCVALQSIGAAHLEMRKCADGFVHHHSAMIENFLKLARRFAALTRSQIRFSPHIYGITAVRLKLE